MEKYKFSDTLKKLNNNDTDMLIYIQEQYRKGENKKTGTKYDKEGYDKEGIDIYGYKREDKKNYKVNYKR